MSKGELRNRRIQKRDKASPTPHRKKSKTSIGCFAILTYLMVGLLATATVFFCALTYYIHFYIDSPINVNYNFELLPNINLYGPLDPHTHDNLTGATHLFENEFTGPECLELANDGSIFTGTHEGEILQIKDDRIVNRWRLPEAVTSMGCGTYDTEPLCGRPLGIRIYPNENASDKTARQLIFIDAYYGIFKLDLKSGYTEELMGPKKIVAGLPVMFPNDLTIVDRDTIVFTDSSWKWTRRQFLAEFLELQPNGRLLKLDLKSKEITLLVDKLYFPNGVTLSLDRTHVFFAETTKMRIQRHYISGPNAGQTDIFFDNLPGGPDNIRMQTNGHIWVPLAKLRSYFTDFFDQSPHLRNHIAKIVPLHYMNKLAEVDTTYGFVVIIDSNAKNKIVDSFQDPTGKNVKGLSHALRVGNKIYLGSFKAPYIGKAILTK